jgi:hypothetical protein
MECVLQINRVDTVLRGSLLLESPHCLLERDQVVVVQIHESPFGFDQQESQHFLADKLGSPPVRCVGLLATVLLDDFGEPEVNENSLSEGLAEHHVVRVDVHVHDFETMQSSHVLKQTQLIPF